MKVFLRQRIPIAHSLFSRAQDITYISKKFFLVVTFDNKDHRSMGFPHITPMVSQQLLETGSIQGVCFRSTVEIQARTCLSFVIGQVNLTTLSQFLHPEA